MKKFIIYLRVSTQQQDLETQELKCLDFLRRQYSTSFEWEVYSDKLSSKKKKLEKRKGMMDALNALKPGNIFVSTHIDRLARNQTEAHKIKDIIESKKCGIQMVDIPTVNSPMVFGIYAAIAEEEGNRIRKRVKDKLWAKRQQGLRAGHVPYGHGLDQEKLIPIQRKDKNGKIFTIMKPGILNVLESEAKTLQIMLDLKEKGYSYRKITEYLKDQGYRNRSGNPFQMTSVYRILNRVTREKEQEMKVEGLDH